MIRARGRPLGRSDQPLFSSPPDGPARPVWPIRRICLPPFGPRRPLSPTSSAQTPVSAPVSAEADRRSHHQDRDRRAGDGAGAGAENRAGSVSRGLPRRPKPDIPPADSLAPTRALTQKAFLPRREAYQSAPGRAKLRVGRNRRAAAQTSCATIRASRFLQLSRSFASGPVRLEPRAQGSAMSVRVCSCVPALSASTLPKHCREP
jgi:hypothetical protein